MMRDQQASVLIDPQETKGWNERTQWGGRNVIHRATACPTVTRTMEDEKPGSRIGGGATHPNVEG